MIDYTVQQLFDSFRASEQYKFRELVIPTLDEFQDKSWTFTGHKKTNKKNDYAASQSMLSLDIINDTEMRIL